DYYCQSYDSSIWVF
nr:immunoglobulin light chain junction region [Macaca mulatta]MOW59939.1 immunoglobulin light chain junction region [Macaca mulatta]MOW61110.1 immunoglobulin light chain junction region [Macaca mulatta]MOW61431.1 immunoglobulin light chain junction region [Macaca mulatta]MOX16812.1 immunoglobulin light chain junction region [Macaca mulatta]